MFPYFWIKYIQLFQLTGYLLNKNIMQPSGVDGQNHVTELTQPLRFSQYDWLVIMHMKTLIVWLSEGRMACGWTSVTKLGVFIELHNCLAGIWAKEQGVGPQGPSTPRDSLGLTASPAHILQPLLTLFFPKEVCVLFQGWFLKEAHSNMNKYHILFIAISWQMISSSALRLTFRAHIESITHGRNHDIAFAFFFYKHIIFYFYTSWTIYKRNISPHIFMIQRIGCTEWVGWMIVGS